MKKALNLCTIFFLIIGSSVNLANNEVEELLKEVKQLTEEGYFAFNEEEFMKASAICERILSTDENNPHALYYLTYSQYRLMNIAMVNGDTKKVDNYLKTAIKNADKLDDNKDYKSEIKTLLGGIYMMKLAVNPNDGMVLSQTIHGYLGAALGINSKNPRTHLIKGTMIFNTPEAFGGGAQNAMNELRKAIKLFEEEDNSGLMPKWGKAEAYAWLGRSYQALGDNEKAKEQFEEALKVNPSFGWVKYKLLPSLEKARVGSKN